MRPVIAILGNLLQGDGGEFSGRDNTTRAYTLALHAAGAAPCIVPCLEDEEAVESLLARADGVLISGGADLSPDNYGEAPRPQLGGVEPLRDALDATAVRYLLEHPDLPVLGICRGIQSLAVFGGGTLIQDIPSQVPDALQHSQKAPGWHGMHEIEIEPGSLLEQVTGRTRALVNTFHHQAVSTLPGGFVVSARTADGVVEAIEREGCRFCLGVQFHPELMAPRHPFIAQLFERFVAGA